jgi:hypothetical protein
VQDPDLEVLKRHGKKSKKSRSPTKKEIQKVDSNQNSNQTSPMVQKKMNSSSMKNIDNMINNAVEQTHATKKKYENRQ